MCSRCLWKFFDCLILAKHSLPRATDLVHFNILALIPILIYLPFWSEIIKFFTPVTAEEVPLPSRSTAS